MEETAPVVHASRRCPIHMRDELKHELDAMEELGVITKVTDPTSWVSSIAISRRANGKLRICLDPQVPNSCHQALSLPYTYNRWSDTQVSRLTIFQQVRRQKWILVHQSGPWELAAHNIQQPLRAIQTLENALRSCHVARCVSTTHGHYLNSSKKVLQFKFDWSYLSYYHIFFIIIGIIKKLV